MASDIPPEIWVRIAQFIPSSELQNLYSVNSAFLDLALNEKYRDVNLLSWTTGATERLEHLNQPHIAYRVQRLTLPNDWFKSNSSLYLGTNKITLRMAIAWGLPPGFGRFIHRTARRISKFRKYNALLERIVVNFQNISSLVIVEGYGTKYVYGTWQPSRLLVNVCTTYASNLRTLSLSTYTPNFISLFPPNPSELTSLEEVTFSHFCRCDRGDFKAPSKFFLAIASTLTTLTISFHDTVDEPSTQLLQSFLRQEGDAAFPKLTSLSLHHSGPPIDPNSVLMQFLNQHAATLKHLSLQHSTSSLYASKSLDGLLSPVLPHLETLKILNSDTFWGRKDLASREGLDTVRAYVQHARGTLTSLSLTHCFFDLHDLGILLNLLVPPGHPEGEKLKCLSIKVQVLSPQVLHMLADKFPQLEKLSFSFNRFRRHDRADVASESTRDMKNEDIVSFLLELRTRSYPRWIGCLEMERNRLTTPNMSVWRGGGVGYYE